MAEVASQSNKSEEPTTDGYQQTFVKNEQLASSHNRPRECKDLPLTHRQVASTTRDHSVKVDPPIVVVVHRVQTSCTQRAIQRRIVILIVRI